MIPSLPEEQLMVVSRRKDIFLNDIATDKFLMVP